MENVLAHIGAELQTQPPTPGKIDWYPRLGAYGRRHWVFRPDRREFDGKWHTWEVGGRVTLGPVFLQYSYYAQDGGVMRWTLFETASYAQGIHFVTIGATVDMPLVESH